MSGKGDVSRWSVYVAAIAGGMLAIARFGSYLDVVNDADVGFLQALSWWGAYVAGVGLLLVGLRTHIEADEITDRAWWAMIVGLLVLVLMPVSPTPGFDLSQVFG